MNEFTTFTGKNVDEAVNNALIKLQVTSDRLEYEVIEKGSAGLLGFIGAKPALIKARKKPEEQEPVQEKPARPAPVPKVRESAKEHTKEESPAPKPKKETAVKEPVKTAPAPAAVSAPEEEAELPREASFTAPENLDEVIAEGEAFLKNIFKEMDMDVELSSSFEEESGSVLINLSGENMGLLIGKRGQTLDSLQHLVSLVINKKSEEYLRVKLDTENYRERRKENLERLARSVAAKAKRTRKPVALEPMNPYERRIIHSVLQDDRYVYTKSEGEDPFRHVMVIPNKDSGRKYYHNNRNGRGRKTEETNE